MNRDRREELRSRLAATDARIESACRTAGRPRDEVTLVVVTKFFPAEDVATLVDLGVRDIGENRDQEARSKVKELDALLAGSAARPHVHFIGQAQRNKAGSIARYADVVHSLDRVRLAGALDRGAEAAERTLDVLVQVDLDPVPDPDRGGVAPTEVDALAAAVATLPRLRLRGVMTVAPLGMEPGLAFERLVEVAAAVRADHPEARWISAGMSADLEEAVRHGATHLRVGTAILGSRPPHR